jgi:hypothetical protein
MRCRNVRKSIIDLLDASKGESISPELYRHIEQCPDCACEFRALKKTLEILQPRRQVEASSGFKEGVMNRIIELDRKGSATLPTQTTRLNPWRLNWAIGLAAVVLAGLFVVEGLREKEQETPLTGFALLERAWGAEQEIFSGEGIVHLVNEIVVKPVSDENLSGMRWLPTCAVDSDGKMRFNQLSLPAKVGEGYTVTDEAWYEPATGRFVRVMKTGGNLIFANSYNKESVYLLESGAGGRGKIVGKPVTKDFSPPKNPANFLGIGAGLPSGINEQDKTLVQEIGEGSLEDGTKVRLVKMGMPGPDGRIDNYWIFKVREDTKTIAEMEWHFGNEILLSQRRVRTESVEKPSVAWDLADVQVEVADSKETSQAGVTADMVIPDVSVRHMVEQAAFETYVFAHAPSWAGKRTILDILDVASPPKRMFCIAYPAKDGRHIVLVQSHTYNTMLGPKAKTGKVVYSSPNGFKVWSGPMDKWGANILLQSARNIIKDPPAEDRTGYLLESPEGTFPALAVNGQMTDEELHALVDSLAPAREVQDEKVGKADGGEGVSSGITSAQVVVLTAHSLLKETLAAMARLRSIHIVNDLGGEMTEAWAEFDGEGRPVRLRMDFAATLDGPKVVVWERDLVKIWFKRKNSLLLTNEADMLASFPKNFFDPKLLVEDLYRKQEAGEVQIVTEERSLDNEPILLRATQTDQPEIERRFLIDPKTKLLREMFVSSRVGGEQKLQGRIQYLGYNEPIDPGIFEPKLPENVTRIDQTTGMVGLARGNLSEEEITVQVVREFFQALTAKDYAKAGQIYEGFPGDKMESLFGKTTVVRIVSIGEPKKQPIPGVGGYVVSCEIEVENDGVRSIWNPRPAVRPVHKHPDRWSITGGI